MTVSYCTTPTVKKKLAIASSTIFDCTAFSNYCTHQVNLLLTSEGGNEGARLYSSLRVYSSSIGDVGAKGLVPQLYIALYSTNTSNPGRPCIDKY